MKRILTCLVLVFVLCSWSVPGSAINGLWVHPESVIDQATADKTLGQAQRSGIDNLYVLIFYRQQAWFHTDCCPMSAEVKDGFDPLGYCIRAAHKRGMKVHAWYVNGELGGDDKGYYATKHPDWMATDASGKQVLWFDFTNPDVRRFQRDLMVSAVKNYPQLDGIHFDYIRYPYGSLGYGKSSAEAFRKETGKALISPPDGTKFPIRIDLSANAMHGVTTGKTLAKFGTGLPAIVENRLGKGQVTFFNWHAEQSNSPILDSFLSSKLEAFGSKTRTVRLLVSEPNEKQYGPDLRGYAAGWLARTGVKVVESKVDQCGVGDILIVPCVYLWNAEEASALRRLVEAGMNVVWIDGLAEGKPDLLAVLGMDRPHGFFSARLTIIPVVDDPALPMSADNRMLEEMEKQDQAWTRWPFDKLTDLVRDVYRSAKKARPSVIVSAAVFHTKQSGESVLQDWSRWLSDGIIDYVIPMAYVDDPALSAAFDEWMQIPDWKSKVIPGLSIYTHAGGRSVAKPADVVRRQVEMSAKRGSNGQVYFCCHYISPQLEPVLRGGSSRK